MNLLLQHIWEIVIVAVLIWGIKSFRSPPGAVTGNRIAAIALAAAFILLLTRHRLFYPDIIVLALAIGAAGGWFWAMKINMTQIPAMVAFQNGAGGCAAMLVSFIELTKTGSVLGAANQFFGAVGLIVGAVTFSGSMVAAGKLSGLLKSPPWVLTRHNQLLGALGALVCLSGLWIALMASTKIIFLSIVVVLFALCLGVLFSIRVGGADMPVLIAFLNATTGLAAAFCGMVVESRLLIVCGAMVAASGYVLTHRMSMAMNRDLKNVFTGQAYKPRALITTIDSKNNFFTSPQDLEVTAEEQPESIQAAEEQPPSDPMELALKALKSAQDIIIIPGYGMALASAQFELAKLSNRLEESGKRVKFAIHPVAGRMPGHMNVLLAEAEIDYDKLYEMEMINPEFPSTDIALIVGACDVINPAANTEDDSPISGMPILNAQEAQQIIVCNIDTRPGYSGVENPLYNQSNVILLLGDAKETLGKLLKTM